jgi:hypothetical protein
MLRSFYDIRNALKAIRMTIKTQASPDVSLNELEAITNEQYMRAKYILDGTGSN